MKERMNKAIAFDSEWLEKIETLIKERHWQYFHAGDRLELKGEWAQTHILWHLELWESKRDLKLEIHLAVDMEKQSKELSLLEARDQSLDALDIVLEHYFRSNRMMRLPLDWKVESYEGVEISIKGRLRRPKLESEADAWLNKAGYDIYGMPMDEDEQS